MAKAGFRIMDSDIHVLEPHDLWVRYMEPAFRDRAPRFAPIDGLGLRGLAVRRQGVPGVLRSAGSPAAGPRAQGEGACASPGHRTLSRSGRGSAGR